MTNDLVYWTWIVIDFVATLGIAALIMKKTKRMGLSFWISTVVNALIIAGGIGWLMMGESDLTLRFGIVVYIIAFVNSLIFDAFVLLSIRNKSNPIQ